MTVALDEAAPVAEAPAEPAAAAWHARRALGFGASDVPALLRALGVISEPATQYIEKRARVTRNTRGLPRIIAEKAGLVAPLAAGSAASKGAARERELLATWRALLERRIYADETAESLVVPSSIRHADAVPRCWWPLVDRHAPILTATLDAWATDYLGSALVVEIKCSMEECLELPWWWRWQVIAQLAVSGADYGLVVCGERWSAWHGDDGPVRVWLVERDEQEIEMVRDAARRGWAQVQGAKK